MTLKFSRYKYILVIAAGLIIGWLLGGGGTTAHAGWGDEENTGGLLARSSLLGGEVDVHSCDDGAIATWKKANLTYKIVNTAKVDAKTLARVRAGVEEWNKARSPYRLSETTGATADITITTVTSFPSKTLIGTAYAECKKGSLGITKAQISLKLTGLGGLAGIQNLAAHETGHALGLGHSNRTADLMEPNFQKFLEQTLLICPSNMNINALSSKTDPYKMNPLLWLMLPIC